MSNASRPRPSPTAAPTTRARHGQLARPRLSGRPRLLRADRFRFLGKRVRHDPAPAHGAALPPWRGPPRRPRQPGGQQTGCGARRRGLGCPACVSGSTTRTSTHSCRLAVAVAGRIRMPPPPARQFKGRDQSSPQGTLRTILSNASEASQLAVHRLPAARTPTGGPICPSCPSADWTGRTIRGPKFDPDSTPTVCSA